MNFNNNFDKNFILSEIKLSWQKSTIAEKQ